MEFRSASRKAIALLLLVFVLGIAFGAVGTMMVNRRVFALRNRGAGGGGGGDQTRLVNRLTHDLNLTPDQQKQLSEILTSTQTRYNGVRQQMNPQFEQIRNQSNDQIRQILTPDQRPKFEEFLRRVVEERRNRPGR
jgi:Spy/CpxP family protein refolding chaperone